MNFGYRGGERSVVFKAVLPHQSRSPGFPHAILNSIIYLNLRMMECMILSYGSYLCIFLSPGCELIDDKQFSLTGPRFYIP